MNGIAFVETMRSVTFPQKNRLAIQVVLLLTCGARGNAKGLWAFLSPPVWANTREISNDSVLPGRRGLCAEMCCRKVITKN